MPSPSDYVRALESGLPSIERGKRLLMILQGFFDDSGSSPNQPIFVLAGFLAPSEAWAEFSDIWAATLKGKNLDYFKMSEATALQGQFEGWLSSDRDAFVFKLVEIVGNFAKYRIDVSVLRSDYDDLIRDATPLPQYHDPYYLLFQGICRSVFEFQRTQRNKQSLRFYLRPARRGGRARGCVVAEVKRMLSPKGSSSNWQPTHIPRRQGVSANTGG